MKIKESEKKRQVLRPCQRTKKAVEQVSDGDTNCSWYTWNDSHKLSKGAGKVGNRRTNRDYPNYSIVEIGQNTEKYPGDMRRLAIT